MRLYRDRPDILTRGRWHWCPPGAKPIPYFHVFGSFNQDTYREILDPPIGEVPRKMGRSRGNSSPRFTGQNWCGSEELWTKGSLYAQRGTPAVDNEGIPVCCKSGPPTPGGIVANGAATFPAGVFDIELAAGVDVKLRPIPTEPVELLLGAAVDVQCEPRPATTPDLALSAGMDFKLLPAPSTPVECSLGIACDFDLAPAEPTVVECSLGIACDFDLAPGGEVTVPIAFGIECDFTLTPL